VAQRNRAAVHVEPVVGNAQLVAAVHHLHGKGLVEFPQVDVVDLQAQFFQHLGHRKHRADAHFVGLATGHRKAQEAAQRLQALLRGQSSPTTTQAPAPSLNWLALPALMTPPGSAGRMPLMPSLVVPSRVPSSLLDRDLLRDQAHDLVGHAHGHGDGRDFGVQQPAAWRGAGLLLAGRAVFVHGVAGDAVALGHLFGGLQHAPVDLGLFLLQHRVEGHVHVHLLLHAGNALHPTGHVHLAFTGDDALRGQGDGLQARGAEAVDGHARDGDGAAGGQRDLARDVHAGGAFGVGAAHDHVFHLGGVDAGALQWRAAPRGRPAWRHGSC
jgi:hypothetical protein